MEHALQTRILGQYSVSDRNDGMRNLPDGLSIHFPSVNVAHCSNTLNYYVCDRRGGKGHVTLHFLI